MNLNAVKGALLVLFAILIGVVVLARGLNAPDTATVTSTDPPPAPDASPAPPPAPASDQTAEPAPSGNTTTSSTPAESSTEQLPATTTSTTELLVNHPYNEVKVLIANGTDVCGAAGRLTTILSAEGFLTLDPVNAPDGTRPDISNMYYMRDYELDAQTIATKIGASLQNLLPMPTPPPVPQADDSHVLVLIGADDLAQDNC